MMVTPFRTGRAGVAASGCAALWLAGCASFSPDAGMHVVSGIATSALGQDAHKVDTADAADATRDRLRRLLASPLSAEAAVQIALINNKRLQAAYNELGLAEAVSLREASGPAEMTGIVVMSLACNVIPVT